MPGTPVTIYTALGGLFSEQAKAWLSKAKISYTDIDTTADVAKVAEMKRLAQGTWVLRTIVIGQQVGLGVDPEWIQARLGLEEGSSTGGTLSLTGTIGRATESSYTP